MRCSYQHDVALQVIFNLCEKKKKEESGFKAATNGRGEVLYYMNTSVLTATTVPVNPHFLFFILM